ncbi:MULTISPECIES: aldehyde dehydrogenase family protein [Cupriavidus]|uniref:Aldehyde dehydrogenase family protein n=1 Tax=Cupriavidus basilensis TaxID=68895 RepID=A0A643G1E6_9BURK|nr:MULTISPECIES: aldehyde dehydrogenase family protein [Cupriavidus]KUE88029.1 aldehyde dehydrogenase [Cupriavidus necator]NOV23807.1 aldehyde dehydrogenase family protein [Cupriavidus necator]QOT81854.1 aldehyde dehydrogenase family protein [Cupriavidus basilensis]BDB30285.1 aldehyde dehydrogenase family protein [Cupriavidus sp. P-10]
MTTSIHRNYIGGEWVEGPRTGQNINPSDTDDVIGAYTRADAKQAEQAIDAAFDVRGVWERWTAEQRADALDRVGTELLARCEALGELLSREEGKTRGEGVAEAVRAGRIFKFFAGEALRVSGEKLPVIRPCVDVEVTREPEGVVGIITPWNFPLAIPAWKIAPALAYGNTVVFKPADLVPGSAWALAEIIVRAGKLPAGVFNLVMGPGSSVGQAIAASRKVRAVSFTGSVDTGRHLGVTCVQRGAKVQMEMGGKNPLVILDDANLDVAVSVAIQGSFYSTGQRCTGSSRLVVQEGIHDAFVAAMTRRMSELRIGHALKDGTDIGPVASQDQLEQDCQYIDLGVSEGGRLVSGGERLERDTPGFYLSPALITETRNDMRVNREEIFGPVATVIRVKDYEEALAVANDTDFGLSSGICTNSLKYATDFKRRSVAGMVMVNVPTAGVDYHSPFGGRKGSSYGAREQGTYAREFYTAVKTAYTLS